MGRSLQNPTYRISSPYYPKLRIIHCPGPLNRRPADGDDLVEGQVHALACWPARSSARWGRRRSCIQAGRAVKPMATSARSAGPCAGSASSARTRRSWPSIAYLEICAFPHNLDLCDKAHKARLRTMNGWPLQTDNTSGCGDSTVRSRYPISAALFPDVVGESAQLVWTRRLKNDEKILAQTGPAFRARQISMPRLASREG